MNEQGRDFFCFKKINFVMESSQDNINVFNEKMKEAGNNKKKQKN